MRPYIYIKLANISHAIVRNFNYEDWTDLGLKTGCAELIHGHPRLLSSLSRDADDYENCVYAVVLQIAGHNLNNLAIMQSFVLDRYSISENVSTAPSRSRLIVFAPTVFDTPERAVEDDLVAVMMPFLAEYEPVFTRIKSACETLKLQCVRAKDIWDHSTIIQDIFSLIFRSRIVVCDFSGRNPNVFYEAGISHTLGKAVIPLAQTANDIPFDLAHHRYLHYLNNEQGLLTMEQSLRDRLAKIMSEGTPDRRDSNFY